MTNVPRTKAPVTFETPYWLFAYSWVPLLSSVITCACCPLNTVIIGTLFYHVSNKHYTYLIFVLAAAYYLKLLSHSRWWGLCFFVLMTLRCCLD